MGIGETIAPTSDQLDAVDLLTGPRTFTVERATVKASDDQPVNVYLAEFPRPWRPGKSMRRVLVAVWGDDETKYAGRRLTLFCDPRVKFGGEEVGGVRISHMDGIDKPRGIPLLVTRGRSATYVVKPLTEPAAPNWPDLIAAATTRDELTAIRQQAKDAKVTNGAEIDRLLAARAKQLTDQQPAGPPADLLDEITGEGS